MTDRFFDAAECIVGRVATKAAKAALLGDNVFVLNCEKAVISGRRDAVLDDARENVSRPGRPSKGPFFDRTTDKYVRRIITRMLPRSKSRGREAVHRVLCYTGLPDAFKDKKLEKVEGAHFSKLPTYKYVTIAEVCKTLGGKR